MITGACAPKHPEKTKTRSDTIRIKAKLGPRHGGGHVVDWRQGRCQKMKDNGVRLCGDHVNRDPTRLLTSEVGEPRGTIIKPERDRKNDVETHEDKTF